MGAMVQLSLQIACLNQSEAPLQSGISLGVEPDLFHAVGVVHDLKVKAPVVID
jgi:hypothetical protein